MSMSLDDVFSYYDAEKVGFIFSDNTVIISDAAAKLDQAMEVRVITKNKRNLSWKKNVKPTGEGTLTVSMHMPINLKNKLYGLVNAKYKANAGAYGIGTKHEKCCITALVVDEDGNQALKAYPVCQVTSGLNESLTANQDNIEEVELEISVTPDENGMGVYNLYLTDTETVSVDDWISSFNPAMVTASA